MPGALARSGSSSRSAAPKLPSTGARAPRQLKRPSTPCWPLWLTSSSSQRPSGSRRRGNRGPAARAARTEAAPPVTHRLWSRAASVVAQAAADVNRAAADPGQSGVESGAGAVGLGASMPAERERAEQEADEGVAVDMGAVALGLPGPVVVGGAPERAAVEERVRLVAHAVDRATGQARSDGCGQGRLVAGHGLAQASARIREQKLDERPARPPWRSESRPPREPRAAARGGCPRPRAP